MTGDAGFIGFHLANALLGGGHEVLGIDGMTDYYDVQLKRDRLAQLEKWDRFTHVTERLEATDSVTKWIVDFAPSAVFHLAAQAGVRYSLEAPQAYLDSNVSGTFSVLEAARVAKVDHLLVASTSSVYGGNDRLPFAETDTTRAPMSLYAASKIAAEALAHSYANLWDIPTTCFRFFTVYGPWGRPDMALFKFVSAIKAGRAIDVYGQGSMRRDFTYIDDLVRSMVALEGCRPVPGMRESSRDTVSGVAPFRIVNIGGGQPVPLMDFIEAVEESLGEVAEKNMLGMQPGDVVATESDTGLLRDLVGEVPATPIREGVRQFVEWYSDYYG
ncbi:MAG: NAD-dependent epimerase/dehydratase family protein [Microbacterium sp.]|uniref:NAD-dependent epimerase/dehydratase family protein n=1 Tax=Microbacterium sp. TaxID=51671 RepID=UPI0032422872